MIQRVPRREPGPRRFTAAEYQRMGEVGILGPEERVELLDGEVRVMTPIGPDHCGKVNRLNLLLVRHVGALAVVSVQNALVLDDHSCPQPDFAVLKPRADYYETALPGPGDVYLVIEVSDSSLSFDAREKTPRYARANIPETWIVDLQHQVLRQFSDPREGAYQREAQWRAGETITSTALPELRLRVDDVFAGAVSKN